jgi:hypothetical protein
VFSFLDRGALFERRPGVPQHMAESRLRRAARTLRDPWGWLVAVIGGGAAWAVGLPIAGAGAIGVGMLAAATAVGAVVASDAPDEPELRPGTRQRHLVSTLDGYLEDLHELGRNRPEGLAAGRVDEAVAAATSARGVALRVAGAVDDLDQALGQADRVARQMTSTQAVSGSLTRMSQRRDQLLAKLSGAVDGVGELYTKLLELSATTGTEPVDIVTDPVGELNTSLDAIRQAFAELDDDAGHANEAL